VREAIGYAFDFEWSNKTLFFGDYARTRSFYQNSEMEAKGLPSDEELKILEPFRGKIPDEVFTTEYNPPVTDGSGNNRAQLEQAAKLLDAAGWTVVNGVRMKDGQPLSFEFLLDNPLFERITEPMIRNLAKIGIQATMRTVDSAQYVERLRKFDFDIVVATFAQSLSPGNEQRDFWGSAAADQPDSYNILGIKNPVIDQLVEELIAAPTRHDLIIHARALDRVLQWSHYVVPQYHFSFTRIAFWDKFGRPEKLPDPPYGTGSSAWWVDPAKAAQLAAKKQAAATVPSQPSGGQATPATPAGATPPEADRGRSPIVTGLYGLGIVVLLLVAFALGRRGRK
jgi:microcin C transport system substrate-binding protein